MSGPDAMDALLKSYPLARAQVAGSRVSYRRGGKGPTDLVLVHGIGSQSASWVQQFDGLATRFRVTAWDAPGYGESDHLAAESPVAADYAGRLLGLLSAAGVERSILVASSLGALIATSAAVQHPQRVAGLVLLNPAGGYGFADPKVREERLAARLERLARLGPAGMAADFPSGMLSPRASDKAREIAAWSQARIDPKGYAQAARMLSNGTLANDAARYSGPVLVVAACADTITPPRDCEKIAGAFPRAQYRLLEGPGHLSYVESPGTINELITEFAAQALPEARA